MADSVAVGNTWWRCASGAFLGKSIPEAAKLCLQIVKRKLTSREVADSLRRAASKPHRRASHTSPLYRLGQPSRIPAQSKQTVSYWGLADWYPAGVRSTSSKAEKAFCRTKKGRKGRRESSSQRQKKAKAERVWSGPVSRITQVLHSPKLGQSFSAEEISHACPSVLTGNTFDVREASGEQGGRKDIHGEIPGSWVLLTRSPLLRGP